MKKLIFILPFFMIHCGKSSFSEKTPGAKLEGKYKTSHNGVDYELWIEDGKYIGGKDSSSTNILLLLLFPEGDKKVVQQEIDKFQNYQNFVDYACDPSGDHARLAHLEIYPYILSDDKLIVEEDLTIVKQYSIRIDNTDIIIEFNSKGEELKARVSDEHIELKKISSSLEASSRKYLAGAIEFIQHAHISHDTVPQRLDPCEADVRENLIMKYKF